LGIPSVLGAVVTVASEKQINKRKEEAAKEEINQTSSYALRLKARLVIWIM
jgi:hypothetical protein